MTEQSQAAVAAEREMLELAAKAAGIDLRFGENDYPYVMRPSARGEFGVHWNPMQSDAEAFRLAVKLHMSMNLSEAEQRLSVYFCDHRPPNVIVHQKFDGDPAAATRLAITRAAAAIGASMKGTPT